ncbi:tetratricopeptide repeat protein [Pseudomonas sp. ABC1]|uniref:tetratricopeptide repeat protein n=1 Tax=Pseudomonas sp. ABC1 TaxID=2748080 RepID=UPI0015C2ECA4|nr:tetratricopeptide repeat protein [Pseudomonas sp. ABC1]QLF94919.1 tetratricopeptide repeat protein [Pseudomonas sp. ABC1]
MRLLIILCAALLVAGCGRSALDRSLDSAYVFYEQGDCGQATLELSRAERLSRSRGYLQPEISLLRGQCLERQGLFVDAVETYQFIVTRYTASEYAYRARARLETLHQLGHHTGGK